MRTIIDKQGSWTLELADQSGKLVYIICCDGVDHYRTYSFERAKSHYRNIG